MSKAKINTTDRVYMDKKPKHLYSGKMGFGRDRR